MVVAILIGACSKDDGVDYCKNHGVFHADHLDTVANLIIEILDDGGVMGSLSIPNVASGDAAESELMELLRESRNLFTLQSESPCAVSVPRVAANAESLEATFAANCGADNKLGKIDVSLFDHLSELEEVVTSVTTSATSKQFAISRQCDSPIFRLD